MTRIIDIVPGRDAGHVAGPFPSDFPIADGDYVGYFCNAYGEELVFCSARAKPPPRCCIATATGSRSRSTAHPSPEDHSSRPQAAGATSR